MDAGTSTKEKFNAVSQLLQADKISIDTFKHIKTIVNGIHPDIDKKLEACSKAFSKLQKFQSGDVIALSVEALPEETEKDKERKRVLLFFINSLKSLQSEIKRVDVELNHEKNNSSSENQIKSWSNILTGVKGPFGIITITAILIVGFFLITRNKTQRSVTPRSTVKIQVILFGDKQIPLSQLHIGQTHIPGCDSSHYHAKNGSVMTLDGVVLQDLGSCGFGKVKDVKIIEVDVTSSTH